MAADGSGYVLQSLLVMLERRFKRDSELLARSASYRVSRQPSNRQGDLSLAKIGSSAEAPPARGRMGGPRGADEIHQAPPRIWGGLRSGNGIRAIILWKPGEASSGRTIRERCSSPVHSESGTSHLLCASADRLCSRPSLTVACSLCRGRTTKPNLHRCTSFCALIPDDANGYALR